MTFPDPETYPARLREHWRATDAATRRAGRGWYREGEAVARELSALLPYGRGPVAAAAVLAALSPRAQWSVNVRWARELCRVAASGTIEEPPAVGMLDGRGKAWRIALGERPGDVLAGGKVRAFWRNLCGDREAVTVDIWAARAVGYIDRVPPAHYPIIAAAYRSIARELRIPPRDLQAAIWLQVRGVKPTDPQGFRPMGSVA